MADAARLDELCRPFREGRASTGHPGRIQAARIGGRGAARNVAPR